MKEGKWLKKQFKGTLLKGKILGLVGLGNIGLKVAYLAKSFGMQILVYKRNPPDAKLLHELNASYVTFKELLKKSDIISIHIPLSKDTLNMIGEEEFSIIKRGAILVNTARGRIINQSSLYKNLINGHIGGVAIDVYDVEPPENFELIKLNNVVATPHIGSQTLESQSSASVMLANKILKYFENTN
jgi:D-3-phosphoglycerate dehydrogenase